MWIRVVGMGSDAGHQKRITKAMQSHFAPLPQAKGARKDHKPMDPDIGYPMRVMMDGKKGPNGPLANLMSQILRPVRLALNETVDTEVINTEELCYFIQEHNKKIDNDPGPRLQPRRSTKTPPIQGPNFVVGSMDVKSLYPNCKKEKSAINIEKAFKITNLEFKNIDREFLVK